MHLWSLLTGGNPEFEWWLEDAIASHLLSPFLILLDLRCMTCSWLPTLTKVVLLALLCCVFVPFSYGVSFILVAVTLDFHPVSTHLGENMLLLSRSFPNSTPFLQCSDCKAIQNTTWTVLCGLLKACLPSLTMYGIAWQASWSMALLAPQLSFSWLLRATCAFFLSCPLGQCNQLTALWSRALRWWGWPTFVEANGAEGFMANYC